MLGRSWVPGRAGCSSAQGGRRRRAGAWGEGFSRRLTRSRAPSTFSGGTSGPKSWSTDRRRRRGAGAASGSELPVRIRPSKYLQREAESSEDVLSSPWFRSRARQLCNLHSSLRNSPLLSLQVRGPGFPFQKLPAARTTSCRNRSTHPGSPTPALSHLSGVHGLPSPVPTTSGSSAELW